MVFSDKLCELISRSMSNLSENVGDESDLTLAEITIPS